MADEKRKAAAPAAVGRKPKKRGNGVASFLILFLILAALVSILAFNLFNIRNGYIYPYLARIPLIGGFIPITANNPEDLGSMTADQMIARINDLESQLSQAQDQLKAANDTIGGDKTQIDQLKEFQSQQLQYKQDKLDFDQRVAMGDPQAYADYYQSISPENAEILYPKAAAEADRNTGIKNYLNDIKAMDEVSAADMLQQMIGADMRLVVSIMQGLDSRTSGNILSEMDPQSAASIIKMMSPYNAAPAVTPAAPGQTVNSLTDMPRLP